ncbi:MAG: methionyl-tRNA formyltransferase [Rhabdochlamydiaceae bacterium]|nr:methionyl-tRNA formyltransferase [Rhabdochlamydiaceae bacterium]
MKIVFFGTSEFSVTILKHLLETSHQIIAVVTKPEKPQGRSLKYLPSPVKEWVKNNASSVPLYEPVKASAEEFVAVMQSLSPDVFVVASYGEIMKTALLNVPRLGPINVHASLLPKWRGAAPIQRSLMAGEEETGVTIMKMVLQLDAGDMLDKAVVKVPLEMNHGELEEALALAAKEPLIRVLAQIESGTAKEVPQDPMKVTIAAKITPADTVIDWKRTALEIHNQIRALSPHPGAWTQVEIGGQIKKLKIKRSQIRECLNVMPKKTHLLNQKEWVIESGTNLLSLLEVQLEGKKALPIGDFLRGLHQEPRIL